MIDHNAPRARLSSIVTVTVAVLASALALLVIAFWGGVGGPFEGALTRPRLPWSTAELAPLALPPGGEPLVADALRLRAARRDAGLFGWGTPDWNTPLWFVVWLGVVAAACSIWWFERKSAALRPIRRHAVGALAAPVLWITGGLWLSRAVYLALLEGAFEFADAAAWRSVPEFVAPAVALFSMAFIAALAGLVSIARSHRGERAVTPPPSGATSRDASARCAPRAGFVLAATTGALALWALMWTHDLFVAPLHLRGASIERPLALPVAFQSPIWPEYLPSDAVQLDLWREAGELRCNIGFTAATLAKRREDSPKPWSGVLPADGQASAQGAESADGAPTWRDALAAHIAVQSRAPIAPGSEATVPDGVTLLAIDRALTVEDARPALEALRELGVWKLGLVTAGPARASMPFVLSCHSSPPSPPAARDAVRLELVAGGEGEPAALVFGEKRWPNVYRFLDSDSRGVLQREAASFGCVVDPGLSWAALVQVQDALHAVSVHTFVIDLER